MMKELEIRFDNQPLNGDKIGFTIKNAGTPITFDNDETAVDLTFNQNTTITRKAFAVLNDDLSVSTINLSTLIDTGYIADAVKVGDYIFIGGDFSLVGGSYSNLIKIDLNGTLVGTFGNSFNGVITKFLLQTDNKLLIAGNFTTMFGGYTVQRLIRINAIDSSVDTTFNSNVVTVNKFNAVIRDIKLRDDGRILVGGEFTNGIVELNSNGTITSASFNSAGCNNYVRTICTIPSTDNFLIGGDFTSYNSTQCGRIALIEGSTGNLLQRFGSTPSISGFNSRVYKIYLCPGNQTILVSSEADTFNTTSVGGGIYKLGITDISTSTAIDSYFATNIGYGTDGIIHNMEEITLKRNVILFDYDSPNYATDENVILLTGGFKTFNHKYTPKAHMIDAFGVSIYDTDLPSLTEQSHIKEQDRTPRFDFTGNNVFKGLQVGNKLYMFGEFSAVRGFETSSPLTNVALGEYRQFKTVFRWNFTTIPANDTLITIQLYNDYGQATTTVFKFNPTTPTGAATEILCPTLTAMMGNFASAITRAASFEWKDIGAINYYAGNPATNSISLTVISDLSYIGFTSTIAAFYTTLETSTDLYYSDLYSTITNVLFKLNYGGFFTSNLNNYCGFKNGSTYERVLVYRYIDDVDNIIDDRPYISIVESFSTLVASMDKYFNRSPYFTKTTDFLTHATFKIYNYSGYINDITSLKYQVTKQKIIDVQSTLFIDISQLTNEKMEGDISNFITATSPALLGENEAKWVRVDILNYDETDLLLTTNKYYFMLNGFVYPTEVNDYTAFKRILTPYNNIIDKRSSARCYYLNDTLISISYTLIKNDNTTVPGTITPSTFLGEANNYYNSLNIKELIDTDTKEILITFEYPDEEYEIVSYLTYAECKFDLYDLVFKNKNGVLETISMSKKATKTLSTTGNDYLRNIVDYNGDYNIDRHTSKQFNVTGTEEITLNTPFVPESMNDSFKQAMLSEEMWIINNNIVYPVIKVDQSLEFKTQKNDRLINYTIKVKLSHNQVKNIK